MLTSPHNHNEMLSKKECLSDLSKERVRQLSVAELAQVKKERLFEGERIRQSSILEFLPYVKIQEPGELALEYELWSHLVDFFKKLQSHRLIDLIKSKQIGISWALAVYALWKIYNVDAFPVLEISKSDTASRDLLAKSRIVYNNLPKWMQIYTLEPNSGEKFGFKEVGSYIESFPSTETSGLGKTAGLVIHDEAEFHDFFEINLSHTRATVADGLDRQLVSVSTVDKTKPDSHFKNHWKQGEGSGFPEAGQNGFKSLFYGYDVRPNRDESFYEAMVRENESTPWVVEANYPRTAEEALSPQSVQSCFNKDRLDKLWENVTLDPETRQGFIYILCPPRVGVQYVAGVDVGEGVGLDYSSLTIVGRQGLTSEVVAKIYTNELATDLFAYEIDKLCAEYFDPLLVVENNSIGVAVLNKLKELGRPKLFSSEVNRKTKAGGKITGTEKLGWTTGDKNKQTAIVELIQSVNDGSLITRFKPQVKELMEYQWVNGKPVPTGRTHGDTVISLMLANQMLKRVGVKREASMYIGGRRIF